MLSKTQNDDISSLSGRDCICQCLFRIRKHVGIKFFGAIWLCKAGKDVVTRKKRRAVAKGEVRVREQFLSGLSDRDGVLWMSGDGPAAAKSRNCRCTAR